MSEGNILLGTLLVLFSLILVFGIVLAPNPGPESLEAIEVDMEGRSLESSRNIPRPRPRPNKIKPVREKKMDPFDRPQKAPRVAKVDQDVPGVPSMQGIKGVDTAVPVGSAGDAAVNAADAAAGFMGRADYLELLKMRVGAFKKYPPEAKSRREQGRVKVRFRVDAYGEIMSAEVVDGSGSRALDRAAVKAVKSASPFPRAPSGMFSYPLTLELEVSFELT
mgnify:CR=1 FL=1